jgi:hypothetical protein
MSRGWLFACFLLATACSRQQADIGAAAGYIDRPTPIMPVHGGHFLSAADLIKLCGDPKTVLVCDAYLEGVADMTAMDSPSACFGGGLTAKRLRELLLDGVVRGDMTKLSGAEWASAAIAVVSACPPGIVAPRLNR